MIAEVFGLGGVGETQSDEEVAGRSVGRRIDDRRTELSWQPTGGARVLRPAAFEEDSSVLKPTRAQKKNAIVAALFGYGETQNIDSLTDHDGGDARIAARLTAGRYWIAATHYDERSEGAHQLALSVEY